MLSFFLEKGNDPDLRIRGNRHRSLVDWNSNALVVKYRLTNLIYNKHILCQVNKSCNQDSPFLKEEIRWSFHDDSKKKCHYNLS